MSSRYRVQIGIADIDSYSIMFYAHYLRYCERAANACLPVAEKTHAILQCANLVKFSAGVGWNDVVDVRTTKVPVEAGEFTLLHEWLRSGKVVHTCIATYALSGASEGFTGARAAASDNEVRRVRALVRESRDIFSPPEESYRRDTFVVFPDMMNAAGGLAAPAVLDLMERQRTELIGGQVALEQLKASEDVAIVVASMQQFRLHGSGISPRDKIEVASGYVVQSGMFYCVHQLIRHAESGAPIAESYNRLVFAKDNALVRAPRSILDSLGA